MHSPTCVLGRNFHCGSCHQTFGTLTLFDLHRYGHVDRRYCYPAKAHSTSWAPLIQDEHGVWHTPEGMEKRHRLAEARRDRS